MKTLQVTPQKGENKMANDLAMQIEHLFRTDRKKFLGFIRQRVRSQEEAEDILQEAFIKIFSKVKQYSGKGSFEGWLKRIVVNTAISYFRKSNKKGYLYNIELIKESDIETEEENSESDINSSDIKSVILNADFSSEDILKIINNLPENYRIVFNLYVFEEYGHKEIGEMLNMSANTSKSQLSRARKLIQKQLLESIRKTTVA